jgi:redox-sensitive bicupin YhaK (pirin superfamily)
VPGEKPSPVVRRAADRFVTSTPGVVSRHAFSFGVHYDPHRIGYGPLMVCNTDTVEVDHGYPDHPHRDAEIVTWVLAGSLRHTDSFGNVGVVHPGLAQRMSAGSGIVHAELNDAYRIDPHRGVEPVHFVQMWLRPDESGRTPGYAQRELRMSDLDTQLVPVASGRHPDAAIALGTRGATLWATRLAQGASRQIPDAELVYLVVTAGGVELEGTDVLRAGDAAELTGCGGSSITGRTTAEALIWELGRG